MKYLFSTFFVLFLLNDCLAASLVYVRGEVLIDSKPASKGSTFTVGQIIETKAEAMAILDLEGGSKLKLEPNSSIKISSLNDERKGSLFQLTRGNILIKARKLIAPKDRLGVKARMVSLGVRGTLFFVGIDEAKKEADVWMCVQEGEVVIKGKKDEKVTKVKAGEGVVVRGSAKSSKPTFFPWTSKINWNLDSEAKIESNANALKEAYLNPLRKNYD